MDAQKQIDMMMTQAFLQARAQFGDAIKAHWFYDGDYCPGCGNPIDEMSWDGERAISFNFYMYRKRGVLIGYLLCSRCGKAVMEAGKRTHLHTTIETNLQEAYERHMASFN
jgi:hypothetical protein